MDDLVELTRIRETEVGPERTTHRTYQGQNRWQSEIWVKGKELGSGTYGDVWLEEEAQSHRVRAVKRVRKQKDAWDEKKEIAAMARVRQFPQYFAYLHGWYESQDCLFLAMDYFEMGDLSHHLQAKIPEDQAGDITQQLLRGLVELHGMGITHRDLKPTNVFVVTRSASSWDVRIGDFGISKRVSADETALRTITGTRHYMAPELDPFLVDDEETHSYTQAVDVWALGILLFQMLTLQMAFRDPPSLRKYFKGKTAFPEEPLLQESITSPCIEFLMAVLQPRPNDRPTSKDTFSFEWMKTPSGDPGIASVQALLSEVRIAQDVGAVGSSIKARERRSAEPGTHPRRTRKPAPEPHTSYAETFRQQSSNGLPLELLPQKVGPGALAVDAEQPQNTHPAVPRQFSGGSVGPPRTQSPLARSPTYNIPLTMSAQTTSPQWLITPQEKAKYDRFFSTVDTQHKGVITGEQAVRFILDSGLPKITLVLDQDLADIYRKGQLTKDEFAVALHLIRQQRMSPPYTNSSHIRHAAGSRERLSESLPSHSNLRVTEIDMTRVYQAMYRTFAVITVDHEQRHATTVKWWTSSPHWSGSFDLRVTKESVITVQMFGQQRSKETDHVLLGSVSSRVGNLISLVVGRKEEVQFQLVSAVLEPAPWLTMKLTTTK